MKKLIFKSTLLYFLIFSTALFPQNFLSRQLKYDRVKTAFAEKNSLIKNILKENKIDSSSVRVLLISYKKEQILELWAKNKNDKSYKKLSEYNYCVFSGVLGPKRKEGDFQIPEGFYYINDFNPLSNFYLSLGINYPNASDRILSDKTRPGSEIYIHGGCASIGCISITDEKIKELYLYAVYAKNSGQEKIPVYIFPFILNDENFDKVIKEVSPDSSLLNFWNNLKSGYDKFITTGNEINYSVDRGGKYIIKK